MAVVYLVETQRSSRITNADGSLVFEMNDATNYVVHKPVGVGALITPWNLPLYLLSWKVAPAIGMGNSVVCKPSELTPMTADLLMQVIHDIGLPAGVVNLVHGDGAGAGTRHHQQPAVAPDACERGSVGA